MSEEELAEFHTQIQSQPWNDEQPELKAMVLHQAMTISFTLLGNLLMIFVIKRHNAIKKRRKLTPVQMLMIHMCTSDLLFAMITIFPGMLITLTVPNFHGPNILCKFVKFLQVLPMYSSSFLLVAISADRFYAICRPLDSIRSSQYSRPTIRPTMYAAAAWIGAILLSIPQFFIFEKNEDGECTVNYTQPWQYPVYVLCFNIIVWLLPSCIAGILYYCVCKAVWKSMAYDAACVSSSNSTRHTTSSNNDNRKWSRISTGTNDTLPRKDEYVQKKIATVKLTLTIVAANFLLWAPFCVISVIDAMLPTMINPVVATFIMFVGNLNSSMNPWIWFYFNKKTIQTVFENSFLWLTDRSVAEDIRRKAQGQSYSGIEMATLVPSISNSF
uniref:G-protein coupled receptors family 1 profile domain-containing protein n=1 Tax=Panagrolaimus sp. PS1159 TaxID=55785 RepID=A0AC35GCT5_9BILA